MGDLVQTLPALTDAAKAIPGIKFDWIVDESFAHVPGWHSHVENVFPMALRRWGKNWVDAFKSGEPQALLKRLRAKNYDMVVDVQGGFKSAFASRLARGLRSGHDRARSSRLGRTVSLSETVCRSERHAFDLADEAFACSIPRLSLSRKRC